MSDQDNPYGGAPSAGNYQMSYQSDPSKGGNKKNDGPPVSAGAAMTRQSGNAGEIKDVSTDQFVEEVIEASKSMPVLIDFWAPWCEPCKQLTPILEKLAGEFSGQMKLVKMNTEQFPEIAGQMGIQSIPAVVAFVGGKPVDAFMGVKPESEIRKFIEKHAGPSKAVDVDKVLSDARELIANNDIAGATNLLMALLQMEPESPNALALMGTIYLKNNEIEQAENLLSSIAEEHHEKPDVAALKTELELLKQAGDLGDMDQLIKAVEADPTDLQAKLDLSLAQNVAGNREEAADLLLEIIKTNRKWDDDGGRKQLIKYFEAWGEADEATKSGRRKLSTALFS